MRRLARLLLRPFSRLARWCLRPLVRRCDAHLAHVLRTVLYHEPQSAAAWLGHLNSVRDELVMTIAQTRQPNSPGPEPVAKVVFIMSRESAHAPSASTARVSTERVRMWVGGRPPDVPSRVLARRLSAAGAT